MSVKIDDKYDSSTLLFSIPVHENQEIINNQIENILNFNPGAKIILHINKSFTNFNNNKTKYNNVFINSISYNYSYAKGLLWIHIQNFLEAIKINIEFKYFIISSSNEMFIKNGLISYIEQFKNGLQIVKFDTNIDWHNFKKNIEKDPNIINLLNDIKLDTIYGGQTEGQFYEKHNFQKISNIALKHFNKELSNFETEEIIAQTIFKSFNISYGLPFTLQNYSNNITFTPKIIEYIINNTIKIDDNRIKNNLVSPHINNDCKSIFSIKRVDRNFNNVRNYLSRKGFVLNKDIFQLNTYYYSNTSRLILYNDDHLYFKKNIGENSFNWFGFEMDEGYYNLNFDIKSLNKIINFEKIGLKIHFPHEILYNFFFENLDINIWRNVVIPLHITQKQHIIFIFDNYSDFINIELKNIQISNITQNIKNNIGVVLYENFDNNNNDYSINYSNINNMILEPFFKIYNIYKFITILNIKNANQIINNYKPNTILFDNENNINNIFIKSTENIYNFKEKCKIDFKFIIYLRLDSIFKKNITNFNFYINKFNFISYYIPYIDNKISNSYDFISIPYKYIDNFYNLIKNNKDNKNICYSIYSKLKNEIDEINFICDDNFAKDVRTPLIKYLSDITDTNNNKGYLFNKKYLYNIDYKNTLSTLSKNNNNEFYFYKKDSVKSVDYQWIGLYIDNFINNTNEMIYITVSFDIKLLKKINNKGSNFDKGSNFGIKTHEPIEFYNSWINDCEVNIYKKIAINIKINKKNQYIILNFDNYLEEVELYIKNFKIIMEY